LISSSILYAFFILLVDGEVVLSHNAMPLQCNVLQNGCRVPLIDHPVIKHPVEGEFHLKKRRFIVF
jgi:hypothetical protein